MEYPSPKKKSSSRSPSSSPQPLSYLESLPDEILLKIMNSLDLPTRTRTRRVSQRFKQFNPSRAELNNIRKQLRIMGLLLLTGHHFYDLKLNNIPTITIQAKDKTHTSTILLKKSKSGEIIYQTPNNPDYEEEIDKSLLYGSDTIDISHFLNLISTLVDLYPNGTIMINRNKVDLFQDPVEIGKILAKEKFSELDLRDDLVDNFLYHSYVFDEFQRLQKQIPSDVIPILDEIL